MGNCNDCEYYSKVDYHEKECTAYAKGKLAIDIKIELSDDSGLSVRFVPGPMFGCVMFEEKVTKRTK